MRRRRSVFTVGEVADICQVSTRTVQKWIDGGLLCGYVLPGGKDRRVVVGELVGFMNEHKMPVPEWVVEKEEGESRRAGMSEGSMLGGKAKVKVRIRCTDAEVVDEGFESLGDCLDYLRIEIVEKNEFADDIRIWID